MVKKTHRILCKGGQIGGTTSPCTVRLEVIVLFDEMLCDTHLTVGSGGSGCRFKTN